MHWPECISGEMMTRVFCILLFMVLGLGAAVAGVPREPEVAHVRCGPEANSEMCLVVGKRYIHAAAAHIEVQAQAAKPVDRGDAVQTLLHEERDTTKDAKCPKGWKHTEHLIATSRYRWYTCVRKSRIALDRDWVKRLPWKKP